MIGIIVTGHGSFATGLTSGLKLLAGETEHYEAVDFLPEDSMEELTGKLKKALGRLSDCDSVLVLADLAGGSPYNVSAKLLMGGEHTMELVGGTNLPVLLDAYLSRGMAENAAALAQSSSEAGRDQLIRFAPMSLENGGGCEDLEYDE